MNQPTKREILLHKVACHLYGSQELGFLNITEKVLHTFMDLPLTAAIAIEFWYCWVYVVWAYSSSDALPKDCS